MKIFRKPHSRENLSLRGKLIRDRIPEIIAASRDRIGKRGGFEKRLFLEGTE